MAQCASLIAPYALYALNEKPGLAPGLSAY